MSGFTHFDNEGKAIMVDVGQKDETKRVAIAHGFIYTDNATYEAIKSKNSKKGDVLGVARIAGIMAAKKTSELIPLCHILLLTYAGIEFKFFDDEYKIEAVCEVRTKGQTGVEMEALTGVSVSLLTIYDMCKAMDRSMRIDSIELLKKDGGKSGLYER